MKVEGNGQGKILTAVEEGRRQEAEGFVQKGIQTPPERRRLNLRLSRGLNPCSLWSPEENEPTQYIEFIGEHPDASRFPFRD